LLAQHASCSSSQGINDESSGLTATPTTCCSSDREPTILADLYRYRVNPTSLLGNLFLKKRFQYAAGLVMFKEIT
jgi:hypothetical protein